jgi:hypothetical protein
MATLSITPSSGNITAVVTTCKVSVADAASNDASEYDVEAVPTEPELRYYFTLSKAGQDTLRSHVFSTDADGSHVWNSVTFPAAGTWTLAIKDASDDSTVTSTSVSVS